MSTSGSREITLGVDPKVQIRIVEDAGNLAISVLSQDPDVTDIDGIFFNLIDGSQAAELTIYPFVNDELVTGFDALPGSLNTLSNGATLNDSFDVRVELGQVPSSTAGDVDSGDFTFWIDSGAPLTIADLDLSSFTAVVNSDDGTGQVLQAGETGRTAAETVVAVDETFNCVWDPDDLDSIAHDGRWDIRYGHLHTDGDSDGVLQFAPVETDGPVAISFEINADDPRQFEADGHAADKLSLQVRLDDGEWQTLDTFVVDEHAGVFVGSETGQTFGAHATTLSYSGGALDGASESAEFRFVSDISSSCEDIYIDNVTILATEETEATQTADEVVQAEDFDHVWWAAQSDAVEGWTHWDIRDDALHTDGDDDGRVTFEEVETDGAVKFSFDARTDDARDFEREGWGADSFRIEVQVDDGEWATLDEFRVNDEGTALVGSETGQQFGDSGNSLSYSGGILDTASDSVQFRFVSDISSSSEDIYIDNLAVTVLGEPAEEVTSEGSQYDIFFDSLLTEEIESDEAAEVEPETPELEEVWA
ncbi:hypothetical protein [Salipiger mucosus]|uniref:Uncharacterized protein n=1 Tax=Salipiger mucosus DSM 16094 TaxID=1123237 RepID=S9RJS9_9RHOB|nr:hypothetical protein [Salipiger mucosus]EPX78380.1 hypothetical protein Salmuc_03996 [Salipiger mucosus DSM 16094]